MIDYQTRREKIQECEKNFNRESAENISHYYKLNGTPIYYNFSSFYLFDNKHQKFLSFYYDENQIMRYNFR